MAKKRPAGVVPSDGAVRIFNDILRASYARIFATFEGNTLATKKRRAAAMAQIEQIAKETHLDLSAWADVEIKAMYESGMFDAMKNLHEQGKLVRFDNAFTKFHREAIEALADAGISDIAKSMQGLVATGQQLISDAAKKAVLEQVATGQVLGETRREIRKNVVKTLKQRGVSALVDKGGKTWELSKYGDMLARTKMTQAHNSGTVNRMVQSGYDLVQVSDHFGECELCRPWEGEILSATGRNKQYKSLAYAESNGLFHPNCRHVITPVHGDYADESMIWDARRQKYVPYAEQASRKQLEKLEQQKFKDILKQHDEVKAKLGMQGVTDFNKAIEVGDKPKAREIINSLPKSNDVRRSMERLVSYV